MKFREKSPKICHYLLVIIIIDLSLINLKLFKISVNGEEYKNPSIDPDGIWDSDTLEDIGYDLDPKESFYHEEEEEIGSEEDGLEIVDEPPRNYKNAKPSYPFSPNAIKKIAIVEAGFYEEMKTYVDKMKIRLTLMKRYIKDYEESSVVGRSHLKTDEDKAHAIVANPLISHRMLRRFAIDFVEISDSFANLLDEGFIQIINDINEEYKVPDMVDYAQSLESLLRIQRYMNFDTKEFANGKLGDLQTNVSLRSYHALEMGINAKVTNHLAFGVEWIELALSKADEEDDIRPDFRAKINQELTKAVAEHDVNWDTWHLVNDLCFAEKIGLKYGPGDHKRPKMFDIMQKDAIKLRNLTEYGAYTKLNFLTLCSGQNFQSEYEKSRLKCWYETKKNPYWRINPLKLELLNEDPPLLQIYDLLDPKRIQWIINIAEPTLRRSEVINLLDPTASDVTNVRTSSQTWLKEEDNPYFEVIMKKIELITGLSVLITGASETIQVASYGTSHHYDEHLDALMDDRRTQVDGDRIGTFMFYLTDVEIGGKTAFPVLGTAANPVAGSAVFWHNLKLNGQVDKRTWHGGCPVVFGTKWVANKWILYDASWDKRKCSLDPNQ